MADSLVLTGVKDVKKHTGSEMLLRRPKRGGDTHMIKEWWNDRNGKQYCTCTVFDVTVGPDTVKLALKSSMSTNVRIDHDGSFGFNFYGSNEIERACLFTEDLEVIEHYVFPRISGGKVMTVTPADAAPKPDGTSAETIGTVVVAGDADVDADDTGLTYTVSLSGGDASAPTYTWSVTGNLTITGGQSTTSLTVDSGDAGDATVKCVVAQAGASNTPQEDEYSVTIS
jgi:hypothetical protein